MPLNWYPIVLSLLQMAFYFSLSFPNAAMYYFFDNFLQFIELQHICLLYVKEFAAVYNLRPLLLHNLHAFLCWLLPPSTLDQFSFEANDSIDWNSSSMNIKKSDTVGSSLELGTSFLINNWISIASQEDVVISELFSANKPSLVVWSTYLMDCEEGFIDQNPFIMLCYFLDIKLFEHPELAVYPQFLGRNHKMFTI